MTINQSKLGKILVIGAGGYMGKFYMNTLVNVLDIPQEQIIAVDTHIGRLSEIRDLYPDVVAEKSLRASWKYDPESAIVLVNTPSHLQVLQICAEAGIKKVFIEKPLVYSPAEIEAVKKLKFDQFFVGYLINFSGIVGELMKFIEQEKLVVLHALSVWGKNWCAVERPMGGDAEEEMTHPLALILSVVDGTQGVRQVDLQAHCSYVPFVQPRLLKEALSQDVAYPDCLNDSTVAELLMGTKDVSLKAQLLSSFGMFDQERRVEFTLANTVDDFPEFKVKLMFDVDGVDTLFLKEARTNQPYPSITYTGNKLADQIEAALTAFAGEDVDKRLVGMDNAAHLVQLLDLAIAE